MRFRIGQTLLDPGDVEKDAAARTPAPGLDFAHDAARDVISGKKLRRASRILVSLCIAPPFVLVIRGLASIVLRNGIEHEAAAFAVEEDAALTAHAFGDENALHARRPDHAGRMKL